MCRHAAFQINKSIISKRGGNCECAGQLRDSTQWVEKISWSKSAKKWTKVSHFEGIRWKQNYKEEKAAPQEN